MRQPLLSDAQWEKIGPLLPKLQRHRRGRPPKDNRVVLEGILWVLKTGARWRDVPVAHWGQWKRVLETLTAVGPARGLAAHLASILIGVGPVRPVGLAREFSRREFRSR
jgi:transposase